MKAAILDEPHRADEQDLLATLSMHDAAGIDRQAAAPGATARLLRVEEAAELLRVSRWTIYRWVEEGRLQATKLGRGSLRVFTASVRDLIVQQYVSPAAVPQPVDRDEIPCRALAAGVRA